MFGKNKDKDLYNKKLGAAGEKAAVKYLKKKKYKILEKNYTCPFGEADIIARDGEDIVFVEVKTRTSLIYGEPASAVTEKRQQNYRRIAYCYLKNVEKYYIRFDIVEVLDGEITHIKNAF